MKNYKHKITVTKTIVHSNHDTAERLVRISKDIDKMQISETINRIINLNSGLQIFWSSARGWAPIRAANLLSKARLDWQVCLSETLNLFAKPRKPQEGYLILGWANLGSLVEGTMKLFTSAYYEDYLKDKNAIKLKNELRDPDGLALEHLKIFFRKSIWGEGELDKVVGHIQLRRNAIHSFKDRDLGDFKEFHLYLKNYLKILRYINFRLPYPDDVYAPCEKENDDFTGRYTSLLRLESKQIFQTS